MKITIMFEVGVLGFRFKYRRFDLKKASVRLALGLFAVCIVYGDSMAIRGFA